MHVFSPQRREIHQNNLVRTLVTADEISHHCKPVRPSVTADEINTALRGTSDQLGGGVKVSVGVTLARGTRQSTTPMDLALLGHLIAKWPKQADSDSTTHLPLLVGFYLSNYIYTYSNGSTLTSDRSNEAQLSINNTSRVKQDFQN
ncbi:hypothetical protein EG68_03701 [Paragonimus skrjabini miyazakii]|uniref:Uncharacterized protein n=1 Tax=Paragonimus skrjabini miyazakii TaxID=59628 RepID=A0A8S9YV25_9TREM|nr:hypothetical protein EG68_03701 [Paragonimus skrjabini miyazakii]